MKDPKEVAEKADRSKKYMVLACKKEDGDMKPVLFTDTIVQADASAAAFKVAGFYKVEVWVQVVEPQ